MGWSRGLIILAVVLTAATPARAAEYTLDQAHSFFSFSISHLGVGVTVGRFNEATGTFQFDPATKELSGIDVTIDVNSVDTANEARDTHLKNEDFFDVAEHPTMTFKSTSLEATGKGYSVTGDFTLHGVTKPITFTLDFVGAAKGRKGEDRAGFTGMFTIKRSDYGMDNMIPAVGDDVSIMVAVEGTSGGTTE